MRPKRTAVAIAAAAATFLGSAALVPSRGDRLDRAVVDAQAEAEAGLAFVRRARDEADPAQLTRAEHALERSLDAQPRDNLQAFVGMAALANARHDFSGSVEWSRRAIATNPYNAAAYGLLGDALFELGRVRESESAYQKMLDLRPDVASYVRASYALQHRGRAKAALAVLRLASKAAGPNGETAAWVRHQIGDVYAGLGRTRRAARENRIGMALAPGYVPPTVGLAEAHMASGRLDEAIELVEAAVESLPSLEYTIKLGDLYAATGERDLAAEQYAATAALLAEYRRAGVLPDSDFVLFYADHGLRPEATLREARAIYANRPTPPVADALAWALHSAGRDAEAWRYAREATASQDPVALFHASEIARALGKERVADRMGASFETAVIERIGALQPGEVATYGEIALEAGFPGAARAVGNVLARNDGLPWWRVVRADGSLLAAHRGEQERLLRREGVEVAGGRVVGRK